MRQFLQIKASHIDAASRTRQRQFARPSVVGKCGCVLKRVQGVLDGGVKVALASVVNIFMKSQRVIWEFESTFCHR